MGQCYSVYLKVRFTDEEGAKKALQQKIARGAEERTDYSLDHYKGDLGLDLDNVHDLVRLFFGGWKARFDETADSDWVTADFDASYGWEYVMMDAFDIMAPYLEDGSSIEIYPDSGKDICVVCDGAPCWN